MQAVLIGTSNVNGIKEDIIHLIIVTTFTLNETKFFINNNFFNFSKRRQLLTQGKLLDG